MTLRKRLLWLFIPILALTLLCTYELSERVLLSRFDAQDRDLLIHDATRLHNELEQSLKRSLELSYGYARWDDSYAFMLGKMPDFPQRNLQAEMLLGMDFDFMLYLDLDNQVVTEQWLPPDLSEMISSGSERPASYEGLRTAILQLAARQIRANSASEGARPAQLLLVQGTPLLLVATPISNNQSTSEPVGNLVTGHFIDAERLSNLQRPLMSTLALISPPSDTQGWRSLPSDSMTLSDLDLSPRKLLNQQQQLQLRLNNQLQAASLTLQISSERRIYAQGRQAIGFFLIQAAVIGLLALLFIYLGLDYWILQRLQRMHQEVARIGTDQQLPSLSEQGKDELGQLAKALNRMFERLSASESRDQLILDAISDGFFELDLRGKVSTVNRALAEMLDYPRETLLGQSYKTALAKDDIALAQAFIQQVNHRGSDNLFAARFQRRDGSLGHFETRLTFFHDRQGKLAGCRGILRDTSEQMAYQNKLIDMAYRDPLTALGNRKAFSEELQRNLELMKRKERSLALLYIDLDRFKQVNDQYGHDIGDALLISIAQRLQSSLRQPDHVYRLGGDEFTVLLTETDPESAMRLAERLLSSLGQPFIDDRLVIDFVTPSIGIALFPQHAKQAESLIKAADIAMYEAKQQRNRACLYSPPALSPTTQNR